MIGMLAQPAFAQGAPDVDITKTGPTTAAVGDEVTYVVEVTNNGTINSDPLFMQDPLPPTVTYVSLAFTTTGSSLLCIYDPSFDTVFCNGGPLDPGEFHRIVITATVNENAEPGTVIQNSATVEDTIAAGAGEDPGAQQPLPANDPNLPKTATHNLTVVGPDLVVSKTHPGNGTRGQQLTYTMTATNAGAAATTTTATLADTLPAGLTPVSIAGAGWTCTTAPLQCTHPAGVAAGAAYPPVNLTVLVDQNAPASVTNVVTVSLPGEINTGNNSASDPTTIVAPGGTSLTLGLSFNPTTYYAAGQPVTVSYLVTNPTAVTVTGIVVTDPKVPNITCPQTTLTAGAAMTCTGPYTTTAADVATGISPFTATVTGSGGATATASGAITSAAGAVQAAFIELKPLPVRVDPPGIHDRIGSSTVSLTESGGDPTLNFAASILTGAGDAAATLAGGDARLPVKLWIDGSFTLHTANLGNGGVGLLGLGGDYLVTDNILVGAALYLDMQSRTVGAGSLKGRGFVIGPYISAAITDQITLDAAIFVGGSTQDVAATVLGVPFTGTYNTQRVVVRSKIDGLWQMDAFVVRPDATFYLSHETAAAYSVHDAQGNAVAVAGFTNIYLDLSGGTRVERPVALENGLVLVPRVGFRIGVGGQGASVSLTDTYGTVSAGLMLEGDAWKLDTSVEASLYASSLKSISWKAGVSGEF